MKNNRNDDENFPSNETRRVSFSTPINDRPRRRQTINSIASSIFVNLAKQPPWICRWYSTLLVKYSWFFLLLGVVVCVSLTVSSVVFRDLPDFSDPSKGFIPRGKDTLTSRLFILEQIRNEILRQVEAARIFKNQEKISTTKSPFDDESKQFDDEDFDNDREYEESLTVKNLLEDLRNNPNECSFQSSKEQNCLTNRKLYKLINNRSDLLILPRDVERKIRGPDGQVCSSIGLNENYEVYFQAAPKSSSNLLTMKNLRSLCEKQEELVKILQVNGTCAYTLPQMIAFFLGKSSCRKLNEKDVQRFINRMNRCRKIYETGILRSVGLNRNRVKPLELFQYDSCFRHNFTFLFFEYLLDRTFFLNNETHFTAMWFTKPGNTVQNENGTVVHNIDSAHKVFIEKFHKKTPLDDDSTEIFALNFLNIRIATAMKQIRVDMVFVILAIALIIGVTIVYLRSISVALMTNLCVIFSFGCAYFAYKIVLDIDLFPYINLMATFILIGISCDNVFVIFDAWYSEKLDIYNEARLHNRTIEFYGVLTAKQNDQYQRDREYTKEMICRRQSSRISRDPAIDQPIEDYQDEEYFDSIKNTDLVRMMKVNDEQMIHMMGGVLRHAAASVFVTSFTTSAAFFTNLISKIAYVQLFGLFMGLCILFNFLMNITMITAFVIVYEKFFERFSAKLGIFNRIPSIFDKILNYLTRFNHSIFTVYILRVINKLRIVLIIIFFVLGTAGLYIVFFDPKLSPPTSRRYQFFQLNHPFERFEYRMRDEFLSYINEDKDNVTNPALIFVFGVEEVDLIHPFRPDRVLDNKNKPLLIYNDKIDLYDPKVLRWFDNFLLDLNRSDLFTDVPQTYAHWLTIGQLLRGFLHPSANSYSQSETTNQFFVPSTRNETVIAMERLFKFFSESNDFSAPSSSLSTSQIRVAFSTDTKTKQLRSLILIVNMNVTFDKFTVQNDYFNKLNEYFQTRLEQLKLAEGNDPHVYEQVKDGWFVSTQFLFYDLMREVIRGTYTSLICSMGFALIVLMFTSGNYLITLYAMITITFIIADTVAIFVLFGWELNILQTIIIIMSVGLSVDFTVHYGVAYIKADWKRNQTSTENSAKGSKLRPMLNGVLAQSEIHEQNPDDELQEETSDNVRHEQKKLSNFHRFRSWHAKGNYQRYSRVKNSLTRVGSAVFIAGFTSFLAGVSMAPSELTSFSQMGIFLMLIMFVSWLYATWFFLPLLLFIGPIDKFADIPFGKLCRCSKGSTAKPNLTHRINDDEEDDVKKKLNDQSIGDS